MSSSANSWVHCNLCMVLGTGGNMRLYITSCGRVVCDSCCARLRETNCRTCRGPCSQVIPLNSRAPQNVLNLFKDVSDQLKTVFKNLAFQENQKQAFLDHKDKMIIKLRQEEKQQELEVARLHDLLGKRRLQLGDLEQKESFLRAALTRLTTEPRQAPSHTAQPRHMSSAFYAGMEQLRPARGFLGPKSLDISQRTDGSDGSRGRRQEPGLGLGQVLGRPALSPNLGLGQVLGRPVISPDLGFLQMKTPGAWHKVGRTASPVERVQTEGGFFTSSVRKNPLYSRPGHV
jgi:hypothetical protein